MPYRDSTCLTSKGRLLMDIAVTLADYTQKLPLCARIPEFLSRALPIEPISLAIIRQAPDAAPEILLSASSGELAGAPELTQDILLINGQTRPLSAAEAPEFRPEFEIREPAAEFVSELVLHRLSHFPRATVFARNIHPHHRMLLIVHQRASDAPLSSQHAELLQLISHQLVRLLACLFASTHSASSLGEPFDRLTEREWVVLRGLSSDAGEKQLADELGLSPHTLHSHIKSIYRKVGVQGRLPLLLRVDMALRNLRAAHFAVSRKQAAPAHAEAALEPSLAFG